MDVLMVEPMKEPRAIQIAGGLESLQKAVDGYIEAIYPFDDPVALICNEEGKINGLPLNRAVRDEKGEICEIIAGKFLIVGLGEENFCGLSPEMMDKYQKQFQDPEQFLRLGGRIVAVKCPLPKERKKEALHRTAGAEAR